jgi:MATE family multidrug resistance protein
MAIHIAALIAKIPLNALFIFGGLGLPALGGPGAAVATTLIAWLSLLAACLILKTSPFYRMFGIFGTGFVTPQWAAQRNLLRLGIPMGLSYLIEVSAFAFMAIFITRLGETILAGHQITSNFGTVLYMLPLAIANATGTLVAQAIGARRFDEARQIGNHGIRLAAILSSSIGIIVFLGRDFIIRAYTPNEAVVVAALPLFLFIGFYQLFDAIQVTAAFVLRSYRIVVIPTVIYAFSLWGVGLGGGYLLGLDPFSITPSILRGAIGFWLGNSISIALVAFCLLIYLRKVQRATALDHQA